MRARGRCKKVKTFKQLKATSSKRETSIDLAYANFNYKLYKYLKANKISIDDFVNHNKLEFSNEIIKEPHLSIFYPQLRIRFPKSKFVMIIRNPIHNIRSILDRLDIKGNKNKLDKFDKKNISIPGNYF